MIFNTILYILYFVILAITAPLRALNDVSLDSNFTQSIDTANSYLSVFNSLLPIATLLTIFGIFITFETLYFTYKILMWVIKKIPTVN
ncbi:hypothetical protein LCGC14_1369370 [marine sediment metagenome]|uniref:Uncharacterized protein n=1 Tax=marine sediment metagenome TaxID=412755 RepID=A0A0F9N7S9_9ZZZZ